MVVLKVGYCRLITASGRSIINKFTKRLIGFKLGHVCALAGMDTKDKRVRSAAEPRIHTYPYIPNLLLVLMAVPGPHMQVWIEQQGQREQDPKFQTSSGWSDNR